VDADQHQHARGEEGGAAPTLADIALAIDVSFFFSASSQPLKQMHCPSRTKLRHGDCSLGVCVCVRACRYAGEGARRRNALMACAYGVAPAEPPPSAMHAVAYHIRRPLCERPLSAQRIRARAGAHLEPQQVAERRPRVEHVDAHYPRTPATSSDGQRSAPRARCSARGGAEAGADTCSAPQAAPRQRGRCRR